MPRRYKVSVVDFSIRSEFQYADIKVVWAYDAKDAFSQIDLLIDKSIQCRKEKITKVEPYPLAFIEKIKLIWR